MRKVESEVNLLEEQRESVCERGRSERGRKIGGVQVKVAAER